MPKILPLVLTLCALLMGGHGARAGDTPVAKTVLITPFRFYAAQDVAFLNPGIMEMLTTRLLRTGTVRITEWGKSPFDQAAAVGELVRKQAADYILMGGITLFDDRVSTDARLIAAGSGQPVLLFSRFGPPPGGGAGPHGCPGR